MMPMYMNSSQQGQMRPQGHYHHQGFETNPHQMTMDAPCGYWPTPTPSPCYRSCNIHGNFPPYNNVYWPPCYYPPQVPYQHPCCMNHSGFHPHAPPYYSHQPFPVSYQPGYDSEKDMPWKQQHHCAKCSPQTTNNRGVLIEEHEPEIDKGDHGEAVQSARRSNFPYPIVWIPHENSRIQEHGSGSHEEGRAPENMKLQKSDPKSWNGLFPFDESTLKSLLQNQDRRKTQNGNTMELPFDINKLKSLLQGQDRESGSHDQRPAEVKAPENMKLQKYDPKSWNGCFPFDESTLKSLIQNHQDRTKMQDENNTMELPFDVNKLKSLLQGQDGKEVQIQKNKEEPGKLPYPIFWIPSHAKGEDVEPSESKERSSEETNLKSFPSQHSNEGQISQHKGKEGNLGSNVHSDAEEKISVRNIPVEKENHLREPRSIPVKVSENHLEKPVEPTQRIAKREPVENMKKEKSSSSPKASRLPPVCLRVDPLPKRKNGGGSKSLSPPRRKEQEETKVASPLSSQKAESRTVPEASNVKREEAKEEMKESVESNSNMHGGANSTKESREKPAKKTFTEEEAARTIQTRYRGYDVRRWEPIKKLKEIATVREQMGDVKRRIQALEASVTDHHIEEKELVVLEETVMSLLLKLDSVQGLHHSIRDYRKSLARELSGIQEKLDSLRKSGAMMMKEDAIGQQLENALQTSDRSPEEQLAAEAEEEGPEPATTETSKSEADAISSVPEKIEEAETVLPMNTPSDDGNGMRAMKPDEEEEVMVKMLEEQSQLGAEEDAEKVLVPSPEEKHPMMAAEVENQGTGFSAGTEPDAPPVMVSTSTTVLPINTLSDDGNGIELSQFVEEKKLVSDSNTDEQVIAEAEEEEETGLSETLAATGHEPATETRICEAVATSTTTPEKLGEAETVVPINSLLADEDKVMVESLEEEKLHELPQMSEIEAIASENVDRKGNDETRPPSVTNNEEEKAMVEKLEEPLRQSSQMLENAIEVSETEANDDIAKADELPEPSVGVIDDGTQLLSQDSSSSSTREAEMTTIDSEVTKVETPTMPLEMHAMVSETASQEESSVSEVQEEEIEQPEVTEHDDDTSEETKRLMEENQRYKETVETLVKAGREQLEVISKLTGRVKSLEKELSSQKKKTKKRTKIGGRRSKAYREKQETKPMSVSSNTDAVI